MKKFSILVIASLLLFACTDERDFGGRPGSDQKPPLEWDHPSDGPGGDNPGMPGGDEPGGGENVPGEVVDYDGETADDAASDVIDYTNGDIFWEASSNDFTKRVTVTYNGEKATVVSASSDVLYSIDGAYVTIDMLTNSVSNICVTVQGSTPDGGLKIYGEKKFLLALNNLDITSKKGPAINDQCHKRVFVHCPEGTTNRLTDATTYSADDQYLAGGTVDTEDRKAAFFSEGNMIFSGTGALIVNGNYKHAICSDGFIWVRPGVTMVLNASGKSCIHANGDADDGIGVNITGGYIFAATSAAAGKCINCDQDVTISGGKLNFSTSGATETDGTDISSAICIKSDLNVSITGGNITCKSTGSAGKGIKAGNDTQTGNLVIGKTDGTGPTLTVETTGSASSGTKAGGGGFPGGGGGGGGWGGSSGSKPKAIKATGTITINGGDLNISTTQSEGEGIESKTASTSSIVINGGNIYLKCADDCINSAGAIQFKGGRVYAWSTGNDAIDSNYGRSNSIVVNGGSLFAFSVSSPEEAIDADNHSYLTFTKGTIFTSGGQQGGGGSSSPSCGQPCVELKGTSISTGYFTLTDSSGNVIYAVKVPRSLSQGYSFISSSSMKSGSTYKYGVVSSAPSGYKENWDTYYYAGGSASVSSSFTASSGYSSK